MQTALPPFTVHSGRASKNLSVRYETHTRRAITIRNHSSSEISKIMSTAKAMLRSAYEIAREERIRKNNAYLASLGISLTSDGNPMKRKKRIGKSAEKGNERTSSNVEKKKRKRISSKKSSDGPRRRSRRLAHLTPKEGIWEYEGPSHDQVSEWIPYDEAISRRLEDAWESLRKRGAIVKMESKYDVEDVAEASASTNTVRVSLSIADGEEGESCGFVLVGSASRNAEESFEKVGDSRRAVRRRVLSSLGVHASSIPTSYEDSSLENNKSYEEYAAERLEKYQRLMSRHSASGVKLPPSATYQHTVKRVLSMSEKRLVTRVRVIERAQGKYAVLKMRMFAEVLILEGYDQLAEEAEAALGRLLDLPKFKTTKADQERLYSLTMGHATNSEGGEKEEKGD